MGSALHLDVDASSQAPALLEPPDTAAFARAYEQHHDALYRYCRSILRNDHDAHDALSSAITKAFASWQRGPKAKELRPWLFRIAHNEAIDVLRGRRAIPVAELPETATEGLELTVERRERLQHLDRDLSALPENQRAAIVLRELNGLGHEEIAVVLQSTPRAVKQTIYEARVGLLDAEAGRGMSCQNIQHSISDGDKRVLRGRRVRAHLRSCPSCRRFGTAMQLRTADLALLAPPLVPVSATLMLAHALGGGAVGAAGVTAGGVGGVAGAGASAGLGAGGAGALTSGAGVAAAPGALATVGGLVGGKGAVIAAVAVVGLGGGAAVEQVRQPDGAASPAARQGTPIPASRPAAVRAARSAAPAALPAGTTSAAPQAVGGSASTQAAPKPGASAGKSTAARRARAAGKAAAARRARAATKAATASRARAAGKAKKAKPIKRSQQGTAKATPATSPKPTKTKTPASAGAAASSSKAKSNSTRAPAKVPKPTAATPEPAAPAAPAGAEKGAAAPESSKPEKPAKKG